MDRAKAQRKDCNSAGMTERWVSEPRGNGGCVVNKGAGRLRHPFGLRLESPCQQPKRTYFFRPSRTKSSTASRRVTIQEQASGTSEGDKGFQPLSGRNGSKDRNKHQPRMSLALASDRQTKSLTVPATCFHLQAHSAAVSSATPRQALPQGRQCWKRKPQATCHTVPFVQGLGQGCTLSIDNTVQSTP